MISKLIGQQKHFFIKVENNSAIDISFNQRNESTHALGNFIEKYKVQKIEKPFKTKDINIENTYQLTLEEAQKVERIRRALSKFSFIEYIEEVPEYELFFTPNDPLFLQQWYLPHINAEQAWDISTGSNNIVIAIVDDAVRLDHEDLQGAVFQNPNETLNGQDDDGNGFIDDINGWDAADNNNNPNPPLWNVSNTNFTHGTHVAGIAAASTNNSIGMASIGFGIKILPVKIKLDATSGPGLQAAIQGVDYAIASGYSNVVNMSFGGASYSQTFQNLITAGHNQGIVFVAAAGNSNTIAPMYPASYNHVISVAATNQSNQKASFSNFGPTIDVSAPGVSILSSMATGVSDYSNLQGTSMASPLVAGLCGLMLSHAPNATPQEIEDCLKSTATDINGQNPQHNNLLGAGVVNAQAALSCLVVEPIANFSSDIQTGCAGEQIQFFDESSGVPTNWSWEFPGGMPTTSNQQNPVVSYPANGVYEVSLEVSNTIGSNSITQTNYITIESPTATLSGSTSIPAGGAAFLQISFTGNAPYNIEISDGSNNIPINNITQNPFYYQVNPSENTVYELINFETSSGCLGDVSGNANILIANLVDNEPCTDYFKNVLNTEGETERLNIAPTPDGGYVLSGTTTNAGQGLKDLFVQKFDVNDVLIWSKTYGTADEDYGFSNPIVVLNDGSIIVATSSKNYNTYSNRGIVVYLKLDGNGNIIWQKRFDTEGFQYNLSRTIIAEEDYFIISGSDNQTLPSFADNAYAKKFDFDGNLIWSTTYEHDNHAHSTSITKLNSNDGYIYGGNIDGIGNNRSLPIYKIDNDGVFEWAKSYDFGNKTEWASDIINTLDGNLLIYGIHGNQNPNSSSELILMKVNYSGDIIYSKLINQGNTTNTSNTVKELSNGDIIISGVTNAFGNGSFNLFVSRFSINGDEIWTKVFGGENDELSFSQKDKNMFVNESQNFGLVVGSTESFGGTDKDILLVKFSLDDDTLCSELSGQLWNVTNSTPIEYNITPVATGPLCNIVDANFIEGVLPVESEDNICNIECDESNNCDTLYWQTNDTIIPNPSFEEFSCVPTFWSQINCVNDWFQPTNGTPDYYRVGGWQQNSNIASGQDIPAVGNGFTGIMLHNYSNAYEYIAACLNQPFLAGITYRISFQVISHNRTQSDQLCTLAPPPVDLTLFGHNSCNTTQMNTNGCPSDFDNTWIELGNVSHLPSPNWNTRIIEFTPTDDIHSIIFGGPCTLPPEYMGSCKPYFLLDDFQLEELICDSSSNEIDVLCQNNFYELNKCNYDSIELNADFGSDYLWSPNAFISDINIQNPIIWPSENTTYIVSFTDTAECFRVDTFQINVLNTDIQISNNDTTICPPTNISLNATGAQFYEWQPSASFNNHLTQNPTFIGNQSEQIIVRGFDTVGCESFDTMQINVLPCCGAYLDIEVEDDFVCVGNSIGFINNSTFGNNAIVNWDFGAYASPTSFVGPTPPNVQFNEVGVNIVTIILNDDCGGDTLELNVSVLDLPNVIVANDTSVCSFGDFIYELGDDYIWDYEYEWTPINGLDDPVFSNPIATINQPISYNLKVTDIFGCEYFDTVNIDIISIEDSVIGVSSQQFCLEDSIYVFYNASSSYDSLYWNNSPDLNTDSLGFIIQDDTLIFITIFIDDCVFNDSILLSPNLNPNVQILSPDTTICPNENIQLNATGAATYLWQPIASFDNANSQNPTFIGNASETIVLIGTDEFGCIAYDTLFIDVLACCNPILNIDISSDTVCIGNSIDFSNNSTFNQNPIFTWNFGQNAQPQNFVGENPSPVLFENVGINSISVFLEDDCGLDSIELEIYVSDLPSINIANDTTFCLTESTTYSIGGDSNLNYSFTWTPSSGLNNSNISNPIATISSSIEYNVSVLNEFGCVFLDTVSIEVVSIDELSINITESIYCENDSILLILNHSAVDSFYWNNNLFFNEDSLIFVLDNDTTIYVSAFLENCVFQDSIRINSYDKPQLSVSSDTTVCEGDLVLLNSSSNYPILWNGFDLGNSISYNANEDSTFIISSINNDCIVFDTINIFTTNYPLLNISPNEISGFQGDIVSISIFSDFDWTWIPEDGLSCLDCINLEITIADSMIYVIQSENNGCIAYDTLIVTLDIEKTCLKIPDAFSPNNDNINDFFYPLSNQNFTIFDFRIYNRWGELIHRNNEPWDGTYKREDQPLGVYIYYLEYECDGTKIKKVGNVTLIR